MRSNIKLLIENGIVASEQTKIRISNVNGFSLPPFLACKQHVRKI